MSGEIPITCQQCGAAALRRRPAIYCWGCADDRRHRRLAAPNRVRNGSVKCLRIDGSWRCIECHEPLEQRRLKDGRLTRPAMRCVPCNIVVFRARERVRSRAMGAVQRAMSKGLLPHPTELPCADCNRPAECYDHRHYRHPLAVDAVCRSCNAMRGPANDLEELVRLELAEDREGPYLAAALRSDSFSLAAASA